MFDSIGKPVGDLRLRMAGIDCAFVELEHTLTDSTVRKLEARVNEGFELSFERYHSTRARG